ncbi:alginate biosynthesis protein AlgZ/FimS [Chitinimonas prasina]|uniref:Alginate biosynthesis protein AlgZ/FimS n=1 Tax=Chitinimonas prasina TaxID=1434937 RepID=A0ABQ5YGA3_9NEIS|nr:histidine kinase [Chitinimonas prasina]GLR12370.1 alginate biosynthesis protein AlgZ/FimS [Chitinimonas prasina]
MNSPLPQSVPDKLPDTRNLGVMLRVLLSANLFALGLALWSTDSVRDAMREYIAQAALLQPTLLFALGSLALLRDRLLRLPYGMGVTVCVLLCTAIGMLVRIGLADFYPLVAQSYLRTLVASSALTLLLLGYFRLRSRAMSPLLTEARLQALQARIRPHFLFNSLNAVLSLIRSEPRKAEEALEDLADLFRVFMAENRDLVPLAREVALASQYLRIEGLRLGGRMQLEWHSERMPADALVPPLVLQPLLENAVYHGIEPAIAPGIISINIFRSRDELHIDIRNPYYKEGGDHHSGNKMAMGNIRERLRLHFDAEASLKTTVGNDYYQVHVTMPYRTAKL